MLHLLASVVLATAAAHSEGLRFLEDD